MYLGHIWGTYGQYQPSCGSGDRLLSAAALTSRGGLKESHPAPGSSGPPTGIPVLLGAGVTPFPHPGHGTGSGRDCHCGKGGEGCCGLIRSKDKSQKGNMGKGRQREGTWRTLDCPVALSAGHNQGAAGIWGNWLIPCPSDVTGAMPMCPLVPWLFQEWCGQRSAVSPLALGRWAHTSLLLSPWITGSSWASCLAPVPIPVHWDSLQVWDKLGLSLVTVTQPQEVTTGLGH